MGQGSQVHGAIILQSESCTLCAGVRVCETKQAMYLINFGHIGKDLIRDKYDLQVMFPETRRYLVFVTFQKFSCSSKTDLVSLKKTLTQLPLDYPVC